MYSTEMNHTSRRGGKRGAAVAMTACIHLCACMYLLHRLLLWMDTVCSVYVQYLYANVCMCMNLTGVFAFYCTFYWLLFLPLMICIFGCL